MVSFKKEEERFIVLLVLLLPVAANAKDTDLSDKDLKAFCAGGVLCRVHSNGNIEMHSSSAHCVYIIAKKDRANPKAKPIKSTCPWDKK